MYNVPNAKLPIITNADIIQTAFVCIPASKSAVESIGINVPPIRVISPFHISCINAETRLETIPVDDVSLGRRYTPSGHQHVTD